MCKTNNKHIKMCNAAVSDVNVSRAVITDRNAKRHKTMEWHQSPVRLEMQILFQYFMYHQLFWLLHVSTVEVMYSYIILTCIWKAEIPTKYNSRCLTTITNPFGTLSDNSATYKHVFESIEEFMKNKVKICALLISLSCITNSPRQNFSTHKL